LPSFSSEPIYITVLALKYQMLFTLHLLASLQGSYKAVSRFREKCFKAPFTAMLLNKLTQNAPNIHIGTINMKEFITTHLALQSVRMS
jgi:hypothetical protein